MNQTSSTNTNDIQDLRRQIDLLDKELITILSQRMDLIPAVADYKKVNNIERYQHEREKEVIKDRRAIAEKLLVNPDLVEDIIKLIIKDAHRIEANIIGK